MANSGVRASSRSQAMRSALIAVSWAQAVLIAKSREGDPSRYKLSDGNSKQDRVTASRQITG